MTPEQLLKYGLTAGLATAMIFVVATDRTPARLFQSILMAGLALAVLFIVGLVCYVVYLWIVGVLKDG